MGKLYEINSEIQRLQDRCEYSNEVDAYVDLDTGEIMTDEELEKLFQELNMDKREIMEWMAKGVLNDRAEAEAIKAEEKRLADRRKRFERRADWFEQILIREAGGVKRELGVASVSFRKSKAVVFEEKDVPDIICWLEEHGYDDCLKYIQPEVRKMEVRTLIEGGVDVPFCKIEERVNGTLK